MTAYKVGQILFVILKKEASVYPMQVVEEITKRTLEGEVTSFVVRAGSDPKTTMTVTDIDGEIFDSAEAAKRVLIERVSQAVSARVDQAVKKAEEWYPSGFEHAASDPLSLIKKTAIVETSAPPAPAPRNRPPRVTNGTLKPEVAALAAEFAHEAAAEATLVELPDGTKARVNSVKLPPSMQS